METGVGVCDRGLRGAGKASIIALYTRSFILHIGGKVLLLLSLFYRKGI